MTFQRFVISALPFFYTFVNYLEPSLWMEFSEDSMEDDTQFV